jgi:hypothetical protein
MTSTNYSILQRGQSDLMYVKLLLRKYYVVFYFEVFRRESNVNYLFVNSTKSENF